MNPKLLLVTLTVISFLASIIVEAVPLPSSIAKADTAKISGKVFRSDTKDPYAGVEVKLVLAGKDIPESEKNAGKTKTDEKGNYSFAGVKPGTYLLSAVIKFKDQSELPCVPSPGALLIRNPDKWLIAVGRRDDGGIVESVVSNEFPVVAGDDLKMNIDLRCK